MSEEKRGRGGHSPVRVPQERPVGDATMPDARAAFADHAFAADCCARCAAHATDQDRRSPDEVLAAPKE